MRSWSRKPLKPWSSLGDSAAATRACTRCRRAPTRRSSSGLRRRCASPTPRPRPRPAGWHRRPRAEIGARGADTKVCSRAVGTTGGTTGGITGGTTYGTTGDATAGSINGPPCRAPGRPALARPTSPLGGLVTRLRSARLHQPGGEEFDDLVRAGQVRRPRASLPEGFWRQPAPSDADGLLLGALLEERPASAGVDPRARDRRGHGEGSRGDGSRRVRLVFSEHAWEDSLYWQKTDRAVVRRIDALIRDVRRSPHNGIGKPEPLQYATAGTGRDASPASTVSYTRWLARPRAPTTPRVALFSSHNCATTTDEPHRSRRVRA